MGAILSSPSVPAAQANGILGIGPSPNDYGPNQYYSCNGGTCSLLPSGSEPPQVVLNPVTGIHNAVYDQTSTDYNGIGIAMNSITGASQAADYGNLTFGIGTESNPGSNNNPASNVQVYPGIANEGGVIQTQFGGVTIESYMDTGTNAIAFNDSKITECPSGSPPDGPWYCPASPVSESAVNEGGADTPVSPAVNFTVGNAEQLIQNGVYALPELAGPFGTPAGFPDGLFDWGLPFFYGRSVYVGFAPLASGKEFPALINSKTYDGPFFAY